MYAGSRRSRRTRRSFHSRYGAVCSVRLAIVASIATDSTGHAPTALSWESITASVPSRIALATSVTSARVGREEATIESSICVAVITGRARAPDERDDLLLHDRDLLDLHLDAEVAAGDHHAVGGAHDLLRARDRLRLLDLGHQRQPRVLAQSTISSARRTKDSAMMSTPIRSPVRTCSRSSSGTAGSAAVSPGMFRPWREATAPPISTTASISPRLGADRVDPQADGAVGEVHDLVASTVEARPA